MSEATWSSVTIPTITRVTVPVNWGPGIGRQGEIEVVYRGGVSPEEGAAIARMVLEIKNLLENSKKEAEV